jgi:MFS family permease
MARPLRWYNIITINIFFLALTVLSQTNGLVYPLLIQNFVGEATKGTRFGELRLWSLMAALLWQAVMGMFSDRNTSRYGRRRPFIFVGTLGILFFLVLMGVSSGMEGMAGFYFLFGVAILMSFASNTAHGALQGLIPDLVPDEQRGRYSAVKAMLEIPIPLILVSFTVAQFLKGGNYWLALGFAAAVVLISMLLTMLTREKPLAQEDAPPFDWRSIVRLLGMTAVFTVIILGLGWMFRELSRPAPFASVSALLGGAPVGDPFGLISSPLVLMSVVGLIGLLAMFVAVAAGVWISVRISVGNRAASANPSFTWWVINRLAFLVGATNLSGFAIYFLQGRLGLKGEEAAGPASRLIAVIGVFILLAALPSGLLGDRLGHKKVVAISGFVGALGVLVALLVPSMTFIYIGSILIGIATGFFFTANWALGTRIVPQAEAGKYLGISNLAGAGAGAVGAYIGGPIADYLTVRLPGVPGAGYVLLFAIYGVMFLVSVLALRGVTAPERATADLAAAPA